MSEKAKKPFTETGIGKFLQKAGAFLPDMVSVVAQAATGNISGAIDTVRGALAEKAKTDGDAAKLLQELEVQQMNWEAEMERIASADRANARQREVALAQAGKRDWTPPILAAVAVLLFGFALYVVAFRTIPPANREMFTHVLGIIEGGMITLVFQYYFGSSAGSRRKTDIMKSGQ